MSHLAAALWHHEKALILFFFSCLVMVFPPIPASACHPGSRREGVVEISWCWSKTAHPLWICIYLMGYLKIPLLCASACNSCNSNNDASSAGSSCSALFFFFFPLVQTMQNLSVGLLLLQVGLYLAVKWIKNNFFFPRSSSVL